MLTPSPRTANHVRQLAAALVFVAWVLAGCSGAEAGIIHTALDQGTLADASEGFSASPSGGGRVPSGDEDDARTPLSYGSGTGGSSATSSGGSSDLPPSIYCPYYPSYDCVENATWIYFRHQVAIDNPFDDGLLRPPQQA